MARNPTSGFGDARSWQSSSPSPLSSAFLGSGTTCERVGRCGSDQVRQERARTVHTVFLAKRSAADQGSSGQARKPVFGVYLVGHWVF